MKGSTEEIEPQLGSPGQPPTYMNGTTSATLPRVSAKVPLGMAVKSQPKDLCAGSQQMSLLVCGKRGFVPGAAQPAMSWSCMVCSQLP